MSITINGTTGIAGVDGSATTPAFQGTDTNTGLFYGTDIVGIATGGLERARVDSSGNVGIGTSSPVSKLNVSGGNITVSAGNGIAWSGDQTRIFTPEDNVSGGLLQWSSAGVLRFNSGASERMRIDSSGNVLVGTTSQVGSAQVCATASTATYALAAWNNATSGNNTLVNFGTEATFTQRGSITYNRGAGLIAYNTSSDYRLKENIVDLPDALDTVSKLKPRQFDWKETGNTTTGFIAHELAEVLPHAVTGEKDAVDAEGKPIYQGIDTSFLVATLTAAIKELSAKVDAQQQEINALKEANNV